MPEREVILAGMDLDVVSDPSEKDIVPDSIVVVASDNAHVHGLTAFLSECWPLIKKAHSKATLHVVGKVGDVCHVDDPAIRYSGWIMISTWSIARRVSSSTRPLPERVSRSRAFRRLLMASHSSRGPTE